MPKHFLNNYKMNFYKSRTRLFLQPKLPKNEPLTFQKVCQILKEKVNFRGHLSNFGAKNTLKRRHFITKNKGLTLHTQSKATLKKLRIRLFRPTKTQVPTWLKRSTFGSISIYERCFWLVGTGKKIKSSPLVATDI